MASHTWQTAKADTRGTEMQRGRWPGRLNLVRWRLTNVGPGCGTWFVSLTGAKNFKLAPTFMVNLCTSGVYCWKRAVNWKFWGNEPRSPALWTVNAFLGHSYMIRNSVCITVNIHSGHTLDVMQILCSQCCASFATNVSSDKGFTCAVNHLLNHKEIIPNYLKQGSTRQFARYSAGQ